MIATATIFLLFALLPHVFAGVFITAPVQGSTGQGGQNMTITWIDDKASPSLTQIGPCEVGIFAGNSQQQTELQPIIASIDVGKQSSLSFKVDPTVGPNSGAYFIRITSLGLKDANNSQFNYEAFSAKFTLSNMSGKFTPAVQAQINGVTSASAGPTNAPLPAVTFTSPVPTKIATVTSSASSTKATTSSTAKPSASNAALVTRSAAGFTSFVAAGAVLFGFLV